MTKRIKWTHEEWLKLAQAWSLQRTLPSMRQKILGVQGVLPEARRRNISDYVAFVEKIEEVLSANIEAAFDNRACAVLGLGAPKMHQTYVNKVPEPVVKEKAAQPFFYSESSTLHFPPAAISEETTQQLSDIIDKEAERYATDLRMYLKSYIQAAVESRISEINRKQDAEIQSMIDEEFNSQMRNFTKKYGVYVEKVVQRKRAVVVGLLGSQASQIKQLVGDSMNLTFIESDAPMQQLRKSCQSADYVLMMRKFISHKCTNVINKGNHSGFFLIDGGLLELEEKLISLV